MNKQDYYKQKSNFTTAIAVLLVVLLLLLIYKHFTDGRNSSLEKSKYESQYKALDSTTNALKQEKKQSMTVVYSLQHQLDSIKSASQKERETLLKAAWRIKREYAAKFYGGVVEQPDTNLLCFGEVGVDSLNSAAVGYKECLATNINLDSTNKELFKVISSDSVLLATCEAKAGLKDKELGEAKNEAVKERKGKKFFQKLSGGLGVLVLALILF